MKRHHIPVALVAIALAVLLLAVLPRPVQHRASAPPHRVVPETPRAGDIGFRTHERLVEHYRRHGREFGSITMEEYLRLAQMLRDRPAGGDVLEFVRRDRVTTRFDRASGAFIAFGSDRKIRTFFKPRDGEAYFRRQQGREAAPR